MARQSVNINGNYGSHYFLDFDYVENSTDVVNNTSNITITGRIRGDAGWSFYGYPITGKLYVDGVEKKTATITPTSGQIGTSGIQLVTWTGNVSHNNDGTKNITIKYTFDTTYPNLSYTENTKSNWALTTIPRKATLTSSADLTLHGLATSQSLTFKNDGNMYIKLEYLINNVTKATKNIGRQTSYSVTFTKNEIESLLKNSYQLKLSTYSDSGYTNLIGSETYNGNITVKGFFRKSGGGYYIPYIYKNGSWKMCTAYKGNKEAI